MRDVAWAAKYARIAVRRRYSISLKRELMGKDLCVLRVIRTEWGEFVSPSGSIGFNYKPGRYFHESVLEELAEEFERLHAKTGRVVKGWKAAGHIVRKRLEEL